MTEQECRRLRPGDLVEVRESGRAITRLARVVSLRTQSVVVGLARRPKLGAVVALHERKANGRAFPHLFVPASRVSFVEQVAASPDARLLATAAGIHADWLEEHGHGEAAAALRRAFPAE